jgi:hypothetical protein
VASCRKYTRALTFEGKKYVPGSSASRRSELTPHSISLNLNPHAISLNPPGSSASRRSVKVLCSQEWTKPTRYLPKPTLYLPKPTRYLPKPTLYLPKPTRHLPKPTLYLPKPTRHLPKPTLYLPKPTRHLPKLTLYLPKPKPTRYLTKLTGLFCLAQECRLHWVCLCRGLGITSVGLV